jgi:copper chaperone CopZ
MMMIALNTLVSFTGLTKSIDAGDKLTIKISGMTCNHCTETIENGIRSMGVSDVDVNLDSSIATISATIDVNKIKDKIRSLGFEIND